MVLLRSFCAYAFKRIRVGQAEGLSKIQIVALKLDLGLLNCGPDFLRKHLIQIVGILLYVLIVEWEKAHIAFVLDGRFEGQSHIKPDLSILIGRFDLSAVQYHFGCDKPSAAGQSVCPDGLIRQHVGKSA